MRERTVRELRQLRRRIAGLGRFFPKIRTLRDLSPFAYDALPLKFVYDRAGRRIVLELGVELERLLGIQDYLLERAYIVFQVGVQLPLRPGLEFRESFYFINGDGSGDGIIIDRIGQGRRIAKLKRMGLWVPPRGYVVHFPSLEFLCLVQKLKCVDVSLMSDGRAPRSIFGPDRQIEWSSAFPLHGLSLMDDRLGDHLREKHRSLRSRMA